jgi:hypothetical protein
VSAEAKSWVPLHPQDEDDFWPWEAGRTAPAERTPSGRKDDADTFWPWLQAPATGGDLGDATPAHLDALYANRAEADRLVAAAGGEAGRAAAAATTAGRQAREDLGLAALFANPEECRLAEPAWGVESARSPAPATAPTPSGQAAPASGHGAALAGLIVGAWHALTGPLRRRKDRRRTSHP